MLVSNSQKSPYLRFFFLCDKVVQHEDRRVDVSGIISDCLFTNIQLKMPPSELTVTMVVGIHSEDRFRTYALRVGVEELDRPEVSIWNSRIGLIDGQYHPIKTLTYDLTFMRPGIFWFNAYLDGDLVGRYPLSIEYAPISDS